MGVNGVAAAQKLLTFGAIRGGYCLYYVWQAFKAVGASTGRSAPTALVGWERSDGKHHGDRNPPAGVPVWFGAKASSNAGDVVISLGGGRVAATDYPRYGVVGTCTIDEREKQIGRPYLGWTERIFDQAIDFVAPPVPAAAPAPAPAGNDDTPPAGQYNPFGIRWSAGFQKIAKHFGSPKYRGAIDGKWDAGGGSIVSFTGWLRANGWYKGNNTPGVEWRKGVQRWLATRSTNPYRGKIDGDFGPATRSSLYTAESENFQQLG